ncbi:MAG TPA: UvrD-helicase domain-containing protein [Nitriliruptorales bacterium]|nr:UvrD-helicase domain-containing protein [Nitriliruptorales bacterium]
MTTRFALGGSLPAGTTVLEASAGTGKTYTIAGLVARYVADGLRLPELLVVTFTRAATAELRERVRTRLVQAADHLEAAVAGAPPASDDHALRSLAHGSLTELATRHHRLTTALAEFDAATIATIHGFCQHVQHGVGLAGDADRDASFLEDQTELVETAVDDLLVRTFHRPGDDRPRLGRRALLDIARVVVANPDASIVPTASDDPVVALRVQLARAVRVEVDRRKRAARQLSYDDLLIRLATTLRDPTRGAAARRRLRTQYRVALIDEFQDTDPVQWDILARAFGGRPGHVDDATLVLIGDPKQAIYTFRGADVYAYLAATASARQRHTLATSWRSDERLLRAYNALLDGTVFGDDRIRYRPVDPAPAYREPRLVGAPVDVPLRLRVVRRDADVRRTDRGRKLQADSARRHVAGDVAAEIVALLSSPAQVIRRNPDGTELDRDPIRPRHIAVLVRTNAEAALVQRSLRDAGVPAVINGVGSVFDTIAAGDWLRLLEAIERPTASTRVRSAALTAFLGWSAQRLADAGDDELEEVRQRLHQWAAILRDRSVAALWQTITSQERLPERLLARRDGERLLTDLQHIGELLHTAAGAEELGPTALSNWLRERVAEARLDLGAEEQRRRLESDAEAVQVLTIHRSKGLEFPVVLCPFLWAPSPIDTSVPVFHDADLAEGRIADVGGRDGPRFDDHRDQAAREQRGEDLRLLYVALTRARHQAVVWWVPSSGRSESSPLARLLFCRSSDGRPLTQCSRAQLPDDERTLVCLQAIADRAGGTIAVEVTPARPQPGTWTARTADPAAMDRARFDRTVDARWRRTSYSALTMLALADGHGLPAVGSEPDEPVVEDEALVPDPVAGLLWEQTTLQEARLRAVVSPLAELPGGTEVGTFVHAVLQHTDFAADDLDAELARRVAEQRARRQVTIGDDDVVVTGLRRVIDTPLGPLVDDLRLRTVGQSDRLDELGFELPLAGGTTPTGHVTVAAIGDLLRRHVARTDPLAGYAERLRDATFRRAVRGFLAGSIDLVLRVGGGGQASRFVVVDHKTNRLAAPDESLTAWHYRPEALARAMQRGHYPLQALLYTVALHRYLRWRLAGYDPDHHLGGVLYLFLRGMTGPNVPTVGGQPCGVFAWAPPAALVVALSDLLDRGQAGS